MDALALADRIGARFIFARVRLALAEIVSARGDQTALAGHLRSAHAELTALGAPIWAERAATLARAAGLVLSQ